MSSIFRTEAHALSTSHALRADVERTVQAYRRAVRAIATVVMTHWPELDTLPAKGKGEGLGRCQAIEALFHATAERTAVHYPMLERFLGKMPSYLRACGLRPRHEPLGVRREWQGETLERERPERDVLDRQAIQRGPERRVEHRGPRPGDVAGHQTAQTECAGLARQ